MTATLSDGAREEARTPQSYAERSRPWMSWEPPANSSASVSPRPRNQSFFQNPALLIASPVCSYCCSTRECAPESPLHFTLSPSEIGPPEAAGAASRVHRRDKYRSSSSRQKPLPEAVPESP